MTYDLSEDAENLNTGGNTFSIFAEGVNSKRPKAWTQDIYIRILPAFGADGAAWAPCHTQDNRLSPFMRLIKVWDNIGHGDFKGRRKFVSPKSFGRDEYDPIDELNNFIRANGAWAYLNKAEGKDERGYDINAAVSKKPKAIALCNMIDVYNQVDGVVLAEMSVSVFNSMNSVQGVLRAVNTMATEEQIQQNYLWRFANGDITDPVHGPVLRVGRDNQSNKGYSVSVAVDGNTNQVMRFDVSQYLAQRYDLLNLEALVPRKTEEEIVQILLDTLNGVSPSGVHEWEMLRAVFGSRHSIPEPPQVTGQPAPAQNQPQGLGPNPAAAPGLPSPGAAPAAPPAMSPQPPAQQPPVQQPPAQQPPAQQPPVQQPPVQQPVQQQQPAAPQQPPAQQPPAQQPPAQQPPAQQPPAAPQQQPPASPAEAGANAPVPGAPPAGTDRDAFLKNLQKRDGQQ